MPPVRPQFSPSSIHQTHETGEWLSLEQRSKECHVYKRHTADSTITQTSETTHTRNLGFVRSSWIPSKLPKVPADPYSEHNIPGVLVICTTWELSLPISKVKTIQKEAQHLLTQAVITPRQLAQFNIWSGHKYPTRTTTALLEMKWNGHMEWS